MTKFVIELNAEQFAAIEAMIDAQAGSAHEDIADELMGQLISQPERSSNSGELSRAVEDLLLNTTYSYADIVASIREQFPHANTSTKSVASVACCMRKKGIPVPLRLKLNLVA